MKHLKPALYGALAALGAAAVSLTSAACPCAVASAQPSGDACTLPSGPRRDREARIHGFLRDHGARLDGLTLRLRLDGDPRELARRVAAIAEAERACCAPLAITFEPASGGGVVTVTTDTAAGARAVLPTLDALRR